jgi:hypothetical protein
MQVRGFRGHILRFRRITQQLRDHNWLAIGIDFVIVVVGVFLAAQISNWDQSQKQQHLYAQSFDRAIVETHTNLQRLETERATLIALMPVVQPALEDLRACRTDEDAHKRLEAAFAPIGTLPGFSFDTKALDQLISNDSFLPFQSEETRNALMSLSTRLNTMGRNSATLGASRNLPTSELTQPGPLNAQSPEQIADAIKQGAIPSPEMVRKRQLVVPLAEACKDRTLLNELYNWEDMAYFHIVMGRLAADRVRADLTVLGRPAITLSQQAP